MRKKRLKLNGRIKRLKGDRPVVKRIVPGSKKRSGGCGCGRKRKKSTK